MGKYIVFILLLFVLLGNTTESYASKNFWQKKRERYEKAKAEAQSKGEIFDPNEYNRIENQRIERESMSPLTVIFILACIIGGIGLVFYICSNIADGIKNSNSGGKILFIIIFIIILVLMAIISNGTKSNYYDSDSEYWENAPQARPSRY